MFDWVVLDCWTWAGVWQLSRSFTDYNGTIGFLHLISSLMDEHFIATFFSSLILYFFTQTAPQVGGGGSTSASLWSTEGVRFLEWKNIHSFLYLSYSYLSCWAMLTRSKLMWGIFLGLDQQKQQQQQLRNCMAKWKSYSYSACHSSIVKETLLTYFWLGVSPSKNKTQIRMIKSDPQEM